MAYDALSLSVLVKEFQDTLTGGKITKIYQPEKDEIVLYVFNKQSYKLLISANAGVNRIHLTSANFDNPKTAPSFCMLLRKHFTGARLLKFDLEDAIIASNANIGGPTTAAGMAISLGWAKLVGPAMLVGTLGYVIGNYAGTIVGIVLGV